MKRYIYRRGPVLDELVRTEEATPIQGVDFCARCGQDLSFVSDETPCYDDEMSGTHWWAVFEDEQDRHRARA